jgi:hypothetical protein
MKSIMESDQSLSLIRRFQDMFLEQNKKTNKHNPVAWNIYKKAHKIKTKLDGDENEPYCDVILNPFGVHYYVPDVFINESLMFGWIPPLLDVPEIDCELLKSMFDEKHQEVILPNRNKINYGRIDYDWEAYLEQLQCIKKYYMRRTSMNSSWTDCHYEFKGKAINVGEIDYVWISDSQFLSKGNVGIPIEVAQDLIENGMPPYRGRPND